MSSQQIRPRHRTILVLDVEGSTQRTDTAKAHLRRAMYGMLDASLRSGGIAPEHHDPPADRGDGALVLIHPVDEAPKTSLLNRVVPTLSSLLADQDPEHGFRLRVALHAGEVNYDRQGCFGEALDITFRLIDAPEVKRRLRAIEGPLVLVVSDDLYNSVIRHDYEGIDQRTFEPLVRVRVAGTRHRGWIHVPAEGWKSPVPKPRVSPLDGSGMEQLSTT
ncbi:hypothetical protein AB5J62_29810 [Amycolatopsis sp. cg5]|uniref:hypothetical protein n=1 Tax=Amycolatopsis sp. cg5 TaxID=3238802 RepID=UPI0035246F8B